MNSLFTNRHRIALFALRASLFSVVILTIAWGIKAASVGQEPSADNGETVSTDLFTANNSSAAPEIPLNFFNADWKTILTNVCKASDSTLVMREVPPGRFTRYDRRKYHREEAVRILNRELEPKGFRLVEKGRFIDVLHLRSARSEYHRPQLPRHTANARPVPRDWRSPRSHQLTESRVQNISAYGGNRSTGQQSTGQPHLLSRQFSNRQFSDNQLLNNQLLNDQSKTSRKTAADEGPKILRTVRPKKRRAVDIARLIYNSFKKRAELVDHGPAQLPAFQVNQPAERIGLFNRFQKLQKLQKPQQLLREKNKPILFRVGIDNQRNELVIEAPKRLNQHVRELVDYLDHIVLSQGQQLQLVSTDSDSTSIAATLQRPLQLLTQQGTRLQANNWQQPRNPLASPEKAGDDPQKNDPKKTETDPKKQPPAAGQPSGGDPIVIPSIRGKVTIRDVPGVGLVVTGNAKDVEAVMQIIRQLDQQGKVTVPNIQLHLLKNVHSQAMAELLASVYQQLTTIRSGGARATTSVAFIPVVRPNAILILASKVELISILTLIDELDRPVDPKKEFRVFRLRFAVASQVTAHLTALFQQQAGAAQNGNGLGTRVRVIADVRTNSVIIEAPPNDMNHVAALIQKFDQERINSVNRVRIFPLKNAVAADLATLLNTAIQSAIGGPTTTGQGGGQGGGQSSQQLQEAKAVVLEFLSSTGNNKRLVRSGILSDIRITAQSRVNRLVVTAPETSMKLIEVLIRQLDSPSNIVAEMKVFTLANGDATAMVALLNDLFVQQNQNQQQGGNVQLALGSDVSSGLVPLRFSVDPRTNTVIAVGGKEALLVVEAMILKLDESDARQRRTSVLRLRNAPAVDVSTAINTFLQSQRNLANIDPNLVSNTEMLEREIIVVPEPISNSLLLSTTPRYEKEITQLIKELDAAPAQVVIQALLVEVELNNTDELGIELGFQDSMFFDRGVISNLQTINQTFTNQQGNQTTNQTVVSQERTPGFAFNNNPLGNNSSANPSSIASQALSNFSLGRVNGDLGYGGLVLSASSSSISVLLRALSAKRTVHVLSRPQITTLDNQVAQIQVGQDVPTVQGVTTTAAGSANPNITNRNVGIILTVTPRINPEGTIVMEVVAEKSSLAGQGVPIFTDVNTGNVIESPIINITTARSTLAVPNGQTIVMGGMITKTDDTIERKVPWLGDIPYLGNLFRFDSTSKRRSELLIFLTPRIIRNDADAELIKQIESERLHYIERDAERLHGPLFAVPPEQRSDVPEPISMSSSRSNSSTNYSVRQLSLQEIADRQKQTQQRTQQTSPQ